MANYVTIADLSARVDVKTLARLATDGETVVNTEAQANTMLANATVIINLTACMDAAEEEINGWVRGKVDITDTTLYDQFRPFAASLAVLHCYNRHVQDNVPDGILLNAQDARSWAKGVGAGRIILNASPQVRSSQVRNIGGSSSTDAIFTRDSLSGFTRDNPC